jgi:hypothetical protein
MPMLLGAHLVHDCSVFFIYSAQLLDAIFMVIRKLYNILTLDAKKRSMPVYVINLMYIYTKIIRRC